MAVADKDAPPAWEVECEDLARRAAEIYAMPEAQTIRNEVPAEPQLGGMQRGVMFSIIAALLENDQKITIP